MLDRFEWSWTVVVVALDPVGIAVSLYLLFADFPIPAQPRPALPSPSPVLLIHSAGRPGLALPGLREGEHLTVSASVVTGKYRNSSRYQDRGGHNKYQYNFNKCFPLQFKLWTATVR